MAFDAALRGAFQVATLAVQSMPQPPNVAFENVKFTSTPQVPWARLTLVPASSRPLGTNTVTTRHDGLFLVDLFFPANTGTAAIESLAAAVRAAFRPATRLYFDGVAAVVDYAERSKVMEQQPDRLMCSVTVAWHCFAPQN